MDEKIIYGVLVGLLLLGVFQSFQISELKGNLVKALGGGLSLSAQQGGLPVGGVAGGSLASGGSDMSDHHPGGAVPGGATQVGGC